MVAKIHKTKFTGNLLYIPLLKIVKQAKLFWWGYSSFYERRAFK